MMQVGGVPAVLKYLLNKGLLHGDCLTVTGKTLAENLSALPGLKQGQDVIQSLENPIKSSGHLQILYGNLAPEGCVGKITGKEGLQFKGPARVFDSEEDMLKALDQDPMSLKVTISLVHNAVLAHTVMVQRNVLNNASVQLLCLLVPFTS